FELQADKAVVCLRIVPEQCEFPIEMRHGEVKIAVIVIVGSSKSAAEAWFTEVTAGLVRDIRENSPRIQEDLRTHGKRRNVRPEDMPICDNEAAIAVAIIVDRPGPETQRFETRRGNPCAVAVVIKEQVSPISIQRVFLMIVMGHEQIRPAVTVEIGA